MSVFCTIHTNLLPKLRAFAPGFVNYKKGALDLQSLNIAESGVKHNKSNQTGDTCAYSYVLTIIKYKYEDVNIVMT